MILYGIKAADADKKAKRGAHLLVLSCWEKVRTPIQAPFRLSHCIAQSVKAVCITDARICIKDLVQQFQGMVVAETCGHHKGVGSISASKEGGICRGVP